jgi:hypothetical protein
LEIERFEPVVIDSGHSPMVSRAAEFTEVLDRLAWAGVAGT